MTQQPKHRLVTRSDFDGLVCAVLLKHLDLIDEIRFAHPKGLLDGEVEITDRDIVTNLPYNENCYLAFDHHASEAIRQGSAARDNHILDPTAPSAARVVYDYYGGKEKFAGISDEMMAAVDRCDTAQFSLDDVLHPTGWVLLSFLMDPRTGLGRFQHFRISNYQLMMQLIDHCREHGVEEILQLPDIRERVELYFENNEKAKEQIRRCAAVHGNLVVLDLRREEIIHPCNRFLVYAAFRECNISIHVLWGVQKKNTVFAIGNSIFNPTSIVNIGAVAMRYGGGGHANAGTCQVENDRAEVTLAELIAEMKDRVEAIEIS